MWIFLVGPMGAGKSTLCKTVAPRLPECVFCDIDHLVTARARSLGWIRDGGIPDLHQRHFEGDRDRFFSFGMDLLKEISAANLGKHVVVALGAAFQSAPAAETLCKKNVVIKVTGDPDVLYERYKGRPGCYEKAKYIKAEFEQPRKIRVYRSATHEVNSTDHPEEETADILFGLLRSVLKIEGRS